MGMPLSADTPAPVKTTGRREAAIAFRASNIRSSWGCRDAMIAIIIAAMANQTDNAPRPLT